MNKDDIGIDSPSVYELVEVITKNKHLWGQFKDGLERNHVVTSMGTKEYIHMFLEENRNILEEHYFILYSK